MLLLAPFNPSNMGSLQRGLADERLRSAIVWFVLDELLGGFVKVRVQPNSLVEPMREQHSKRPKRTNIDLSLQPVRCMVLQSLPLFSQKLLSFKQIHRG